MAPRKKSKAVEGPKTVRLETLLAGGKFTLPDCGKFGTVLRQSVGGTLVQYEGFEETEIHVHKWPNPPETKVIRKKHQAIQIAGSATVLPGWPTE